MPAKKPAAPSVIFTRPGSEPFEVTAEMLEREHAVRNMVDCVPNPEALTVGLMARLVHDMAELRPSFEQGDQARVAAYLRREKVLRENAGWCAFIMWANTKLGRDADFGATQKLRSRLARRLKRTFVDVDAMPLVDAMRIVQEPEAAAPPSESEKPPEEENKPAAPPALRLAIATKRKRLKRGEPALKICAALQSLAAKGEWGASERDIYQLAQVAKSTYCHIMKNDETAKKVKEAYDGRRLGRGPVHKDDI